MDSKYTTKALVMTDSDKENDPIEKHQILPLEKKSKKKAPVTYKLHAIDRKDVLSTSQHVVRDIDRSAEPVTPFKEKTNDQKLPDKIRDANVSVWKRNNTAEKGADMGVKRQRSKSQMFIDFAFSIARQNSMIHDSK